MLILPALKSGPMRNSALLRGALVVLDRWAERHFSELNAARQRFDINKS